MKAAAFHRADAMTRGIYAIVGPSGKRYIGQSRRIESRFASHKCMLKQGRHHSPYLQNAWDFHGESAFSFQVIISLGQDIDLTPIEQNFIDIYRQIGFYNSSLTAGSPSIQSILDAKREELLDTLVPIEISRRLFDQIKDLKWDDERPPEYLALLPKSRAVGYRLIVQEN